MTNGKMVHYTATVPHDRHTALIVQNKPAPLEWGECVSDVIAHLRERQPGFSVAMGLKVRAYPPVRICICVCVGGEGEGGRMKRARERRKRERERERRSK